MRKQFASLLYEAMCLDPEIYLVTADLGFRFWDQIAESFPKRFYNVGAAEQLMLGIGIGLALEKKKPFLYSITPFLLCRPYELIRTYVNWEQIPVRLIGAGRDKDYSHDGYSHWATDAETILSCFPNVQQFYPRTNEELLQAMIQITTHNSPAFLSLVR